MTNPPSADPQPPYGIQLPGRWGTVEYSELPPGIRRKVDEAIAAQSPDVPPDPVTP